MGGSNRVEKLENQVRELEATVTGLTDELLECKERLAQLEAAIESDAEPTTTDGDSGTDSISSLLDEVDSYSSDDEESTAETETDSDEIIVA